MAADSDFDFVAAEPRRPAKKASAGKGRKKPGRAAPGWLTALWTYRTPLLGGLALVGLLAAIAVNAMFLQRERHPAPLLGSTIRIEPPKPAPPKPVPRPVERPTSIAQIIAAPVAAPQTAPIQAATLQAAPIQAAPVQAAPLQVASARAPAQAAPALPASAEAAPKKKADGIGAMLSEAAPAAPDLPAKTILAAQRALRKLGAPVIPNGAYGTATRRAVEAFQRRNHLPATGELTPKLRQLLALQAGMTHD